MSQRVENAVARFLSGSNCAQAILHAFRDDGKLSEDLALKIATGFGGGMGRKQEVCGAVTGGILVLGLRHGRGTAEGVEAAERTYAATAELMDRFAARHGSCLCRKLLEGYDISTEAGRLQARSDDVRNTICKHCIQTVAEILEDMK